MSWLDQAGMNWETTCTIVTVIGILVTLVSIFVSYRYGKRKGRHEAQIGTRLEIHTGDHSTVTVHAADLTTETKGKE